MAELEESYQHDPGYDTNPVEADNLKGKLFILYYSNIFYRRNTWRRF
jgi:hypothetical protein